MVRRGTLYEIFIQRDCNQKSYGLAFRVRFILFNDVVKLSRRSSKANLRPFTVSD